MSLIVDVMAEVMVQLREILIGVIKREKLVVRVAIIITQILGVEKAVKIKVDSRFLYLFYKR